MKVVVTGANGFVGTRIVERFAAQGQFVRAAARRPIDEVPDGAVWTQAPDLGPDADWSAVVSHMDVLIHCAARVHVMSDSAADPLAEFRRVNRDGTLALARAAAGAGVKRFIFLSSIKVNGEGTPVDRPYCADDPPAPCDPYGISKLEAEQALFKLSRESGMEVVAVRPVLVYGPGVRANFRVMMAAVGKGLPLPLGAVRNRRSMVFVRNLADLIYVASIHPDAPGKVLLVSDGCDLSTPEVLQKLAAAMGRGARLVPVPTPLMAFAARLTGNETLVQRLLGSLTVDISATQTALDWSPPFSVEQGILETVEAYWVKTSNPA